MTASATYFLSPLAMQQINRSRVDAAEGEGILFLRGKTRTGRRTLELLNRRDGCADPTEGMEGEKGRKRVCIDEAERRSNKLSEGMEEGAKKKAKQESTVLSRDGNKR